MTNKPISKTLLVFNAILLVLIIGMVFAIYDFTHKEISHIESPKEIAPAVFAAIPIQAKAVYIFDVAQNKVIFEKNQNAQLPLASLTKLAMALTATNLAAADLPVTIQTEFLEEDGDNGLLVGETWKMQDLLNFTLIVSSNDGARAIASSVGASILKTTDMDAGRKYFIAQMNATAKNLGLSQTYFLNEDGLDETATQSGGYGSAMDVEKLLQYILENNPKLLEATKEESALFSSNDANHTAINTDVDIGQIPGLIASKTGYTALAGGNLAVAFDESIGHPIIIVVLGSTENGRFTDVQTLVKATLNYINQ